MSEYTDGYQIFSWHGLLMDSKPTLEDAKRCLWVWHSASFITFNGKVVFKKEHSSEFSK